MIVGLTFELDYVQSFEARCAWAVNLSKKAVGNASEISILEDISSLYITVLWALLF